MSEYAPDEFAVRGAYNYARGSSADSDAALDAEFDRFIATVQAEAWDEGNRAGASDQAAWDGWRYYPRDKHPIPNPYREGEDDE